MTVMAKLTTHVSNIRANSSPSPFASNSVVMDAKADDMSMLAFASITPALCCTIVCATSKMATIKSKVWLTTYAAIPALIIHLKKMNVSKSCMLFFSTIM